MSPEQLRGVVVDGWGELFERAEIEALGQGDVVTHTSHLWHVEAGGERFVAKLSRLSDFRRNAPFERVKLAVLNHCESAGVAVQSILATRTGEPCHVRDGVTLELSRYIEGQAPGFDAESIGAMVGATLRLRRALETVPERLRDDLAEIPTLCLAEEPDVLRALRDGRALFRVATSKDDAWSRLAAEQLEPLIALDGDAVVRAAQAAPERPHVIHGDLHRAHFLVPANRAPDATVVIDFDNITVGDRALDLAWTCDQAAFLGGSRELNLAGLDLALGMLEAHRAATAPELANGIVRLIAYAIPIVVDIAKDILVRDDRRPVWRKYLDIVDIARKVHVLKHITGSDRCDGSGR